MSQEVYHKAKEELGDILSLSSYQLEAEASRYLLEWTRMQQGFNTNIAMIRKNYHGYT